MQIQRPTATNTRIRSTSDAHKIFLGVQQGLLAMITRRLDADERLALCSGCVYCWEERGPNTEITGLGIERFTEGRRWSPSRVRDEFLFYYERYTPPPDTNQSSEKQPPRDWDPLVKQTYSAWVETDKGRRKWHLTAYFTQSTVDRLGTVDDIPGVSDLVVPDGLFKTTRVAKGRPKGEEPKERAAEIPKQTPHPPNATRGYTPYMPSSTIVETDKGSGQPIQMFQPYPNYNGYNKEFTPPPYPVPSGSRPHPLPAPPPISDPYQYDTTQNRSSTSPAANIPYPYADARTPISHGVPPPQRVENNAHRGPPGPPLMIPQSQSYYMTQSPYPTGPTRMLSPQEQSPQNVLYSPPDHPPPIVNNSPMSQSWYNSPVHSHPMHTTYIDPHTGAETPRSDMPASPYEAQQGYLHSPVSNIPPYSHLSPVGYPSEGSGLHPKVSTMPSNEYPPLLIPLQAYHDENDSGTESSTSEGRRGELGPCRDLAPLHTLARARLHPYRRDPADDKTLRLLDPKAAPSAP